MFDYNNSYEMIESRNQALRREADQVRLAKEVLRARPRRRLAFAPLLKIRRRIGLKTRTARQEMEIAEMPC